MHNNNTVSIEITGDKASTNIAYDAIKKLFGEKNVQKASIISSYSAVGNLTVVINQDHLEMTGLHTKEHTHVGTT